jgi:hypothetical protein
MATNGISGPTGDGVVLSYVDIIGNPSSGWNADPGDGTTGVGSLLVQNFNIIGNGCAEQYPLVWPASNSLGDCTDQGSGGYGDGFGTTTIASPAPGWQVHFDQGIASYNTQDGLDALHISGPGSTMTDTRVLAYGNEGQQLKVGGATATIQNSVINGNCSAMSPGNIIHSFTSTAFNVLNTQCRGGSTAVLINVTPGDPATFQGNTIYSEGSIGLEVEYALGSPDPANRLKYNDNVFMGFYNGGNQANPTPIYSNTDLNMLTNPGASWTNNSYLGYRNNWACPHPGESKAVCTDPGLVDETYHAIGYGNMAPTSSTSAVVGAGMTIANILTDITGANMPTPSMIGALALGSVLSGFDPTTTQPSPTPTPVPTPPPAVTPAVQMANAYKICNEGCTIIAMPPGTVYQFGTGSAATWLPSARSTSSSPLLPLLVYYTSFPVGAPAPIDPAPNVLKEFDVQQTTAAQTIVFTADGSTVPVTKIVPALVPPCTRPIALQVKGATVYAGCAD